MYLSLDKKAHIKFLESVRTCLQIQALLEDFSALEDEALRTVAIRRSAVAFAMATCLSVCVR